MPKPPTPTLKIPWTSLPEPGLIWNGEMWEINLGSIQEQGRGMIKLILAQYSNSIIIHMMNNTIYQSMEHLRTPKVLKCRPKGREYTVEFSYRLKNEVFFNHMGRTYRFKIEDFEC